MQPAVTSTTSGSSPVSALEYFAYSPWFSVLTVVNPPSPLRHRLPLMDRPDPDVRDRRYRRRQRLIVPALIIVAAMAMILWARHREAQRLDRLRWQFESLCQLVAVGGDPTSRIRADSPTKRDGFAETLRTVFGGVTDASRIAVHAETGDSSPWVDGRATHTVMIHLDGAAALGVRITWVEGADAEIIGYWEMASPPAPAGGG